MSMDCFQEYWSLPEPLHQIQVCRILGEAPTTLGTTRFPIAGAKNLEVKEFSVLNSREIIPGDPSPKCHPTASTLIAAFPKSLFGTGHPKTWICPLFPGSSWIGGCWSSLDPGGGGAGPEGIGKDLEKIWERSGKDLPPLRPPLCDAGDYSLVPRSRRD